MASKCKNCERPMAAEGETCSACRPVSGDQTLAGDEALWSTDLDGTRSILGLEQTNWHDQKTGHLATRSLGQTGDLRLQEAETGELPGAGGKHTIQIDRERHNLAGAAFHRGRQQPEGETEWRSIIEGLGADLKYLLLKMHRLDRWTLSLLLAAFVAVFLPWGWEHHHGLVSGIESGLGWLSIAAAALAASMIYLRTVRRRLAGILITAQALCSIAIAIPPYAQIATAIGSTLAFGVHGTLLLGLLAAALTLARIGRMGG